MKPLLLALVLVLLALPAAHAEQLEFGVRTSAEWDDNVFLDDEDEEDDVTLRFAPHARLVDDSGRLTGLIQYEPSVEYFVDLDVDTSWEHVVRGEASWVLPGGTVISVSDRFARLQSTSRFNEIAVDDAGAAVSVLRFDRGRYIRNSFEFALRHQFSSRVFAVLSASHFFADSGGGTDNSSLGVSGVVRRVVGAHDRLGLGASASRQRAERSDFDDIERTRYYSVFGVWEHDFDARTTLELAAGPSLVDSGSQENRAPTAFAASQFPLVGQGNAIFFSDPRTCPVASGFSFFGGDCEPLGPQVTGAFGGGPYQAPFVVLSPPGSVQEPDDSRLTFFANVSLVRRGDRWNARLSYRRRDSQSGGLGSSTISDTAGLQVTWRPARLWRTSLSLTATRFTQASDSQRFVVEVRPSPVPVLYRSGNADIALGGAAEAIAVRTLDLDADSGVTTLAAQLELERRLTERLSLYGRLFYLDRRADSDAEGLFQEYSRFRVVFGVNYAFEPIRF